MWSSTSCIVFRLCTSVFVAGPPAVCIAPRALISPGRRRRCRDSEPADMHAARPCVTARKILEDRRHMDLFRIDVSLSMQVRVANTPGTQATVLSSGESRRSC